MKDFDKIHMAISIAKIRLVSTDQSTLNCILKRNRILKDSMSSGGATGELGGNCPPRSQKRGAYTLFTLQVKQA